MSTDTEKSDRKSETEGRGRREGERGRESARTHLRQIHVLSQNKMLWAFHKQCLVLLHTHTHIHTQTTRESGKTK